MDLDGDGRRDILSGSWPGELFLFRGRADVSFGAAEMIKDKNGRNINIGGGVTTMPDGNVLITGHTTVEKTPEGRFGVALILTSHAERRGVKATTLRGRETLVL